jgi:hypothetical protein
VRRQRAPERQATLLPQPFLSFSLLSC